MYEQRFLTLTDAVGYKVINMNYVEYIRGNGRFVDIHYHRREDPIRLLFENDADAEYAVKEIIKGLTP